MTARSQAPSTREAVERRLRSGGGDIPGMVLQGALLLSLLVALGVLVVLVGDILIRSLPVFAERPFDFLTSPLSSRPARAGIVQGIAGSVGQGGGDGHRRRVCCGHRTRHHSGRCQCHRRTGGHQAPGGAPATCGRVSLHA